jgi:hypothetical protein
VGRGGRSIPRDVADALDFDAPVSNKKGMERGIEVGQAPLFHERPAQTRQHLSLRQIHATLFNDLLRAQEDSTLNDRLDAVFAPDPSVGLVGYNFVPQLARSSIKNEVTDVVLVSKEPAFQGSIPWLSSAGGYAFLIELAGKSGLRFSLQEFLENPPYDRHFIPLTKAR